MPRHTTPLFKLAQRAGMLCNEGGFQKYLEVDDKDGAARRLRRMCQVGSRAELDRDPEAGARFQEIASAYEAWLRE